MRKILVPVDGSQYSDAAVREAIKALQQGPGGELHLLNVQAPIFSGVTLLGLSAEQIDSYYFEAAGRALAEAEKLARRAGMQYAAHRVVGAVGSSIVSKCEELGCDSIVMGTHGRGKVAEMLLGSVAQRVLLMANVPVTLVKVSQSLDMTGRIGIS